MDPVECGKQIRQTLAGMQAADKEDRRGVELARRAVLSVESRRSNRAVKHDIELRGRNSPMAHRSADCLAHRDYARAEAHQNRGALKFVVNRGIEKCLSLYTVDEWNVISAKIKKYNDFNPKVRDFKRGFFNGATMVEVDSAGRLLLPKQLLEYAGIKKDMVMAPCDNKMELWDKDNYSEYMNKVNMNFSDLAEQVMGGDLMDPTES